MKDFVAFDFETANAQRYSICSVGFVFVENGRITDTIYQLINPEVEFDPRNVAIHGITEADIIHSPTFDMFYDEVKSKLEHKLLVAHYLPFDGYALKDNLKRYGLTPVAKQLLCSYQLSKKLLPELSSHTLKSMCQYFQIRLDDHHHALADAKACADIFSNLVNEYKIPDQQTLLEKTRISVGQLTNTTFKTSRISNKRGVSLDLNEIAVNNHAETHHVFYGKRVVFTGKLEVLSRKQAAEMIAAKGAIPQNGINDETNYIILGDFDHAIIARNKSSKLKKAESMIREGYKIEIISELDFLKMLG
ncbi:exonuclease domain-containing protein [Sutcliffiella halmapala]|uniref:exonuclease domain-containing protein n=1 Tax=Sutcliffiella halmapala TaxID=79882 RepID=UPI000995C571|nr:exonuclease domain-containing protein [Sutcliffiella halmapala]